MDIDNESDQDLLSSDVYIAPGKPEDRDMSNEGVAFTWSPDSSLKNSTQFSSTTKFDKEPCQPVALAFSPSGGNLAVADNANNKVKLFSLTGQLCAECTINSACGRLISPTAVGITKNQHILAADYAAGDVKVFTQNGQYLLSFGRALKHPTALYVMKDDSIVVIDTQDVFIYRTFGDAMVKKLEDKSAVYEQLPEPCLICATDNYIVLCVTENECQSPGTSASTIPAMSTLIVLNIDGQLVKNIPLNHCPDEDSSDNGNLFHIHPSSLHGGENDVVLFSVDHDDQPSELWTIDLSQQDGKCTMVDIEDSHTGLQRAVLGKPALMAVYTDHSDIIQIYTQ